MRSLSAVILMGLALNACTTTNYSDTLEQKLAGKKPQEKKVILAQECSNEIAEGLKLNNSANIVHSKRMAEICEEMTGKKILLKENP